jgi:hypothetical protein
MKKFTVLSLTLALVLALSASGALAYDFPNHTEVLASYQGVAATGQAGYTGWYDVIGNPNVYQMYGANLVGNTLQLFTNWKGGNGDAVDTIVRTAALFFDTDKNGTWDKAVKLQLYPDMTGHYNVALDAQLYSGNLSYQTSNQLYGGSSSNYVYGGKWDPADPKDIPTWVTGAASVTTITDMVTWKTLTGSGPQYEVDVDLTSLGLTGPFCFIWGSGDCGNDTIKGDPPAVPLPGAMVLLGAGLVRLAGYARRKRALA